MDTKGNFERKTLWVVLLTAAAMAVEIGTGLATKSMALLADGIHMGSHVLAIGLSYAAYVVVRKVSGNARYNLSSGKILSLSGYTSGLLLLVFALFIIVQAVERFLNPVEIIYREALIVATAGLAVNLLSAALLHHSSHESDHNIRAAYLHVIADAVTSISAIAGLVASMVWKISYIDTVAAVLSSFVIIKWAAGLIKESGASLLDLKN